jgi:hypothetical protein
MLSTHQATADRFWSRVDKSGDCWIFQAPPRTGTNKYPQFTLAPGVTRNASRAAWIITNGDPGPLYVLHRCDNPRCVRPDHLYLGTQRDNAADMDARGRRGHGWAFPERRGERYQSAKLKDSEVAEIIAAVKAGETLRAVGARYGVSHTHVLHLVRGTGRRPA